ALAELATYLTGPLVIFGPDAQVNILLPVVQATVPDQAQQRPAVQPAADTGFGEFTQQRIALFADGDAIVVAQESRSPSYGDERDAGRAIDLRNRGRARPGGHGMAGPGKQVRNARAQRRLVVEAHHVVPGVRPKELLDVVV